MFVIAPVSLIICIKNHASPLSKNNINTLYPEEVTATVV